MAATTFNFLGLPSEIRVIVYETLFQGAELKKLVGQPLHWANGLKLDILLVCHQIRHEAGPILSAATKLVLTDHYLRRFPVSEKYLMDVKTLVVSREWLKTPSVTIKMLVRLPSLRCVKIACMARLYLDEFGDEMFLTHTGSEVLSSYYPGDPLLLMSEIGDDLISDAAPKILAPFIWDIGGLAHYRGSRRKFEIHLQFWIFVNSQRRQCTVKRPPLLEISIIS